jgi:hypothetical protein
MNKYSVAVVYTIRSRVFPRHKPRSELWHSVIMAETPDEARAWVTGEINRWNAEDKAKYERAPQRKIVLGPTVESV